MAIRTTTTILFEELRGEALNLLKRECAQPVRLADVAGELATSPRQLERAFAAAGTTFRDALARVRVERAAIMLEDREKTVAEIAAAVGYRQPAHFAKAFRRVLGLSPAEYRQSEYFYGRAVPSDRRWSEWKARKQAQEREQEVARLGARRPSWAQEKVEAAAREGREAFPGAARPL